MSITIEATYENGVFKPAQPLPLKEHEKVRLTVEPETSIARRTAGTLPWSGNSETLHRLAEDPELGSAESQ